MKKEFSPLFYKDWYEAIQELKGDERLSADERKMDIIHAIMSYPENSLPDYDFCKTQQDFALIGIWEIIKPQLKMQYTNFLKRTDAQ